MGSAYAEVELGSVDIVAGEDHLKSYSAAPGWSLCFCGECGSTLFGVYEGAIHGVTLGSLDGDPGVELEMHIFVGSKAPWDHIGGSAPQHEEHPQGR